jgi:predicted amidohydrolase YtcJ
MTDLGADLILFNGRIATQDDRQSVAEALAIRDGVFLAVGTDRGTLAQGQRAQLQARDDGLRDDRWSWMRLLCFLGIT